MKHLNDLFYAAGILLLLTNCNNMKNESIEKLVAPVAEKEPKELVAHGDTRIDNYYWMRLSDEQKSAQNPDAQTKKVLDYLNAENSYLDNMLGHTQKFQDDLFEELKARIKKDDESVPYFKNGFI